MRMVCWFARRHCFDEIDHRFHDFVGESANRSLPPIIFACAQGFCSKFQFFLLVGEVEISPATS